MYSNEEIGKCVTYGKRLLTLHQIQSIKGEGYFTVNRYL